MIKIKDIGTFESVPQIVENIINSNLEALNEHSNQGWDIEKLIIIDEYIEETPLDLALIMNAFESVKWLVKKGIDLNRKENPSFLRAVRYCNEDIIKYVVAHGAKVNLVNNVKSDAFEQALYGKQFKHLPLIHELGYSVSAYGGKAFRKVVSDQNYKAIDFFITNGVDINYNEPDMVYSFKPTPLCVAARYVDLKMCKYLINQGADVTIAEKDGMRPYSIAIEKGDAEMAIYFKSLEPAEYHNLQNKLEELKPYKLPKDLIDYLSGDNLHLELPDSDFEFFDFFSLTDTVPFKFGRKKLLRISKTSGDYDHLMLVWNPKTKKIAFYDLEHEELTDLCNFKEFFKNPDFHLEKIF
ncbi:ankyrin repeat domain-containing protein [Aureibaculum sp. A20]|uniref:Ankyrin repeat domain-containing protein n=1 Tax=Aureibaculum flavum TaxID=2795986 RepID=A0ABS0WLS1_9FLAO|nr:ankyrin repeat domain-containing protein [Aureibaculum flavum]MBJ2172917.1 ankyrin repeat domain-containing protein [Aureibaculum flavum]